MLSKISNLTVVYGGQWGSEGKGQILAAITRDEMGHWNGNGAYAVRVGGPNAGHTARGLDGKMFSVQSLPIPAFLHPEIIIPVIGAGGIINLSVLEKEIEMLKECWGWEQLEGEQGITSGPWVLVDPNAMIITQHHIELERVTRLQDKIGSTAEGVGAALAAKVRRNAETIKVARHFKGYLESMGVLIVDTVPLLASSDRPVYVEGTQGHLLSIHTSGFYPFCTSRQCGPLGILADIGISPFGADRYRSICVLRTFPIRVGGNSGEMGEEITWEQLGKETGGYVDTPEITTVTKRARRIARWDFKRNLQTIRETRPTEIAITFLDYLFPDMAGVQTMAELSYEAMDWLSATQERLQTLITYVSTGSGQENSFSVRVWSESFQPNPFFEGAIDLESRKALEDLVESGDLKRPQAEVVAWTE